MYGTIQGWADYVAGRGISDVSVNDSALPALVRASDYIKYHYVVNFVPGVADSIPEVELATYEAACLEALKPGVFSKQYTPSEAKILMQMDVLRWEKVAQSALDTPDQSPMVPVHTKVDSYLRRYLRPKRGPMILSVGSNV